MSFVYQRPIRFQETDAAGVMYFANVFNLCHEAYEESLIWADIDLKTFFGGGSIAVPIIHTSADYRAPAFCGDRPVIHLTPQVTSEHKFEIHYDVFAEGDSETLQCQVLTRHICIQVSDRKRIAIPADLLQWIEKCRCS